MNSMFVVAIVVIAVMFGALLGAMFAWRKPTFADKIRDMNAMYKLPINNVPTLPEYSAVAQLQNFIDILGEELQEGHAIVGNMQLPSPAGAPLQTLVQLADWLGDITVYCRSEALKYGIPLEDVLDIIMASNASKLGAMGRPIYDARGKFLKGPHYWKPEPKIQELLEHLQWLAKARCAQ